MGGNDSSGNENIGRIATVKTGTNSRSLLQVLFAVWGGKTKRSGFIAFVWRSLLAALSGDGVLSPPLWLTCV